jgi:hypothetical protein
MSIVLVGFFTFDVISCRCLVLFDVLSSFDIFFSSTFCPSRRFFLSSFCLIRCFFSKSCPSTFFNVGVFYFDVLSVNPFFSSRLDVWPFVPVFCDAALRERITAAAPSTALTLKNPHWGYLPT